MPRQAPQQPMDTNMMGGKPQKQAGFGGTPGPSAPALPKPMDMNPGMGQKPAGGSGIAPAQMPDAVPSFNQRRANAQSLYGPGGSGWANFGLTGGMDSQVRPPAAPAQRPAQMGGPADISRPMGPPPVRPPQFGPPQMGDPFTPAGPQQGGPAAAMPQPGQADFLRQIFSNPGFMQMLQQYMSRQGQMGQRGGPVAGGLPPAGGMQQF